MVRMIAFLAATTALAAGVAQAVPPPASVAAAAQTSAAPPPSSAHRPQYGSFGFDIAGMDRSVAPGDNFYRFANGAWAKNTPIPPDKSNYGAFNVLDDLSRERTRSIIEDQEKTPGSRIGAAYASFMDTAAIE